MKVDMPFVTDFVSRTGGREINEDHCGFLELGESAVINRCIAESLAGRTASRAAGAESTAQVVDHAYYDRDPDNRLDPRVLGACWRLSPVLLPERPHCVLHH